MTPVKALFYCNAMILNVYATRHVYGVYHVYDIHHIHGGIMSLFLGK